MAQRISRRGSISSLPGTQWLTTFNDLITLLMVFFVLIFAMSSGDMVKIKEFRSAIIRGFGALEKKGVGSVGLIETTRPTIISVQEESADSFPEAVHELVAEIDALPGVDSENTGRGVVIRIEGSILFNSGSATINPDAFSLLQKIGGVISRVPNSVCIEGHTDNVPITTQAFPSNWELSAARAVTIVKFLANRMDVYPRRLSAVGYGESRPVNPNDTPEHRAKNRRVEIVLLKEKGK